MKNLKLLSITAFISLLFTACGLDWTMRSEPYENVHSERPDDYRNNSYSSDLPRNTGGGDLPPNAEPGKCYAQCITSDRYSHETEQILEYTGSDYEAEGVKKKTILLSKATTIWEKGKADPNCKSQNPQDCMVMCLVDIPAVKETYYIVTDTSTNKQFKITEIQKKSLISVGLRTGWVEVLCEKDITFKKIRAVQQALTDKGYSVDAIDGIMDASTKSALVKYQKNNGLPEGNLNIETLKNLGVF